MGRMLGWGEEDILEANETAKARERAWLRSLARCSCPRPLPARMYLGRWACALCGKVTSARPRRRGKGGRNRHSSRLHETTRAAAHTSPRIEVAGSRFAPDHERR